MNPYPPKNPQRLPQKHPMKKSFLALALALAMLSTIAVSAHAAPNDGIVGAYARVEVGRSYFDLSGALPQAGSDNHGQAVILFGGYRLNENFGVEAGYAALGSFTKSVIVSGASVQQDGKARSVFGVATGRMPVSESLALQGRVGLSFGEVSGTNLLPDGDNLMGSKTSMLFGLGLEYRPKSNVALTINYNNYGQLSDNVKASALVFGLHFTL